MLVNIMLVTFKTVYSGKSFCAYSQLLKQCQATTCKIRGIFSTNVQIKYYCKQTLFPCTNDVLQFRFHTMWQPTFYEPIVNCDSQDEAQ